MMHVFGPVPSRRLGKSLGINNIPPKICTYSCVYCQLGRLGRMTAGRQAYYTPESLATEAMKKIEQVHLQGERIDYLTIVPDGEPTLDRDLGLLIDALKRLDIKIAVITNASLLNRPQVRADLLQADWVSVKVDAVDARRWRKIDRPCQALDLNTILDGINTFAKQFNGKLVTETMMVAGINDHRQCLSDIAEFIESVAPATAYLSIPTRPPAAKWAAAPSESSINLAYQIFAQRLPKVELLIGYEGNDFAFTGNVEEDILSITSVHPMREDAINRYLEKANATFSTIKQMVADNRLVVSQYNQHRFYLRKLKPTAGSA